MSAYVDSDGIWRRNIPNRWFTNNRARTDMPNSLLENVDFQRAVFSLPNGESISIPAEEMRRALTDVSIRNEGKIIGPFNIDVENSTVAGVHVNFIKNDAEVVNPDIVLLEQLEKDLVEDGIFKLTGLEDARNSILINLCITD